MSEQGRRMKHGELQNRVQNSDWWIQTWWGFVPETGEIELHQYLMKGDKNMSTLGSHINLSGEEFKKLAKLIKG